MGTDPQWLVAVRADAEERYPEEACGLVLAGPGGALRVVAMENVAPDPREHFALDAVALAGELVRARDRGERLELIYHSHPDGQPVLSQEDRDVALAEGQPLWPGVRWLVVSVERGRAVRQAAFAWSGGAFCEVGLD